MTDASPKYNQKKIILGIFALVIAVITAAFFYLKTISGNFLRIEGPNEGTIITVVLEQQGKARSLLPQADGDSIYFFAPEDVYEPYLLTLTLQDGPSYRDIVFTVDAKKAVARLEGFAPGSELSFADQTGLHFDWSGHIKIEQDLNSLKGPLCFNSEKLFVCHTIPKAAR